jgi:diacylglycerol kinase family enzyme
MLLLKAIVGRAGRSGDFEIVAATELRIDTLRARQFRVAHDGELTKMTPPLHYRTRPGVLKVMLPRT